MPFPLENISIVLVEPQSPGNTGMVCRAMKNMGISSLRIVGNFDRRAPDSLLFAVSAFDLLESAESFPTLEEAIADTSVSIAATRRHGKYRNEILEPGECADLLFSLDGSSRGAIVFGREDSGLTTREVSCCTHCATIPVSAEYGSLNLAQAVLIFCYEIFTAAAGGGGFQSSRSSATSREYEELFSHFQANLEKIGFLNPQNPEHIMKTLRRIFFRAALDSREVSILRGILSQSDWAASSFAGRK